MTLLRLTPQHKMAVVEMGANHPGEIKTLVNIVCPDYGLITNVGRAHLEGFGSFEGVKKTKGELYDYLKSHDGMAFVYTDSSDLMEMAAGMRVIGYGITDKDTNYVSGSVTKDGGPFLSVDVKCFDETAHIKTNLIGDYNVSNVLSAVCVGRFFDVSLRDIKDAIENYKPSNNRSQLVERDGNRYIVDAYNANPTSMTAAIRNFASLDMKNKVCILGDMGELGTDSLSEHTKIIELLKSLGLNDVYFVGKIFKQVSEGYKYFDNVDELKKHLAGNPLSNKTVLIKGSNSNKLYSLL